MEQDYIDIIAELKFNNEALLDQNMQLEKLKMNLQLKINELENKAVYTDIEIMSNV